jgi:tellurite methyltransferase
MASSWLVDNERFLPRVGDALDVACGRGRHAFWLAQRGLRTYAVRFAPPEYDVIVVVHYLHRPLFPALIEALRPGGVLVYETFTRAQASRGHPKNPAFLLEPGELATLVGPLEILASREGDYEGRMVSGVIARRGAL